MTDADKMIEIIEYAASDAAARKALQERWQKQSEATERRPWRSSVEDNEESE